MNNKETNNLKNDIITIYRALCEKGYDPITQLAGYILSEDPVYITDWNNARGLIQNINRDQLLCELIQNYMESHRRMLYSGDTRICRHILGR